MNGGKRSGFGRKRERFTEQNNSGKLVLDPIPKGQQHKGTKNRDNFDDNWIIKYPRKRPSVTLKFKTDKNGQLLTHQKRDVVSYFYFYESLRNENATES